MPPPQRLQLMSRLQKKQLMLQLQKLLPQKKPMRPQQKRLL
jgi:hypothetical protein